MSAQSVRDTAYPAPDTASDALERMADIALEKGLDSLSMRDVAKRVGISLAALQYHFPTKDMLIRGLVRARLDDYQRRIRQVVGRADRPGALVALIAFAVERTLEDRTARLFAMLEARAQHDTATAEAMAEFQQSYIDTVEYLLRCERPNLGDAQTAMASALIVAMLEGLPNAWQPLAKLDMTIESLAEAMLDGALAAAYAAIGRISQDAR